MSVSSTSTESTLSMSDHAKSPTVRVVVGTECQEHFLHRSLLSAKSQYFEIHLNNPASSNNSMLLPDINSGIFDDFVDWLYHSAPQNDPDELALVEIYLMASQLGYPDLKDWAMQELQVLLLGLEPEIDFLRYAIRKTPTLSDLWCFLIKKTASIMATRKSMKWDQMYNIDEQTGIQLRAEVRAFKKADRRDDPARKPAAEPKPRASPADEHDWLLIDATSTSSG